MMMQLLHRPHPVIASEAKQSRITCTRQYGAEIASSRYALLAMTLDGIISYKEPETQQ